VVGRAERIASAVSTPLAASAATSISPNRSSEIPDRKAEGTPSRPSAIAVFITAPPG
jgi:hypothetical protein